MPPFKPGHAKTPGSGRPKNAKDKFSVCELKKAFKRAEKKYGMSFYDWLANQAYKDNKLAVALLKKIIPDMKQVSVKKQYSGGYAQHTPAEACEAMDKATAPKRPSSVVEPVGGLPGPVEEKPDEK